MTPAVRVLETRGIPFRLHEYDPQAAAGPSFGQAAAAALGVEPRRMGKSLVAKVDGRVLCVAVVPVAGELDLKGLAAALGGKRAALAAPAEAEAATGYVVGGISPLGHRRRLPVVVDVSLLDHDSIYVSAGRRGLQLELAPADLVTAAAATTAAVARP